MNKLDNEPVPTNRAIQPDELLLLIKGTLNLKDVPPANKIKALTYLLDKIT